MKPTNAFTSCLCLLFCLCIHKGVSQNCAGCSYTVTGTDNQSYTVTPGQTFCVDSLGEFTGTLTINGGNICNKGIFNPKLFSITSGTLNNYSIVRLDSTITLDNGFTIQNEEKGIITILNNFTITNGTFINLGIADIRKNIDFVSGSFYNSAILNCKNLAGAGVTGIINTGIINKE